MLSLVSSVVCRILHSPPSFAGLVVIGVVLFVILHKVRRRLRTNGFINDEGQTIKEVQLADLRLKLLASAHISQQGQALAGSEPYLLRSGRYQELVISQPDHVHDFYRSDYKTHGKPRFFNFGDLFGRFMGTAVGLRYGQDWRKIRLHYDPPFKFHEVARRIERFQREIAFWVNELTDSSTKDLNARAAFKFLVFRLVAIHLYRDAFDDRLFFQLLQLNSLHDHVIHDILTCKSHESRYWTLIPNAIKGRLDKFLSEWQKLNRMIIENSRSGRWECPVEVIARGVNETNDMTEEDFLSTLDEVLFANVDVSASVLSTLMTNLSTHRVVQQKLRSEIKKWKSDSDFDLSKYLQNASTLLHRVVMESMRLSPAFWFAMPETTAEDKKIGGYRVPANTTVIIDNRRLNEEAVTWGSDGNQFRPDRFLEVPAQSLRCGFMRYGTGAASGRCLGKHVADVVFKLTTIAVVEQFALEPLAKSEKQAFVPTEIDKADTRLVKL